MPLALTDLLRRGDPVVGRLRQTVPVAALPRLAESLSDSEGSVEVDVRVSRASSGVPLIEGSLRGCLRRDCQRCLEPVDLDVRIDLKLAVTGTGGEELAPADFEPWQTDEENVTVGQLLEDELLLALPMVTRHENERQCGELARRLLGDEGEPPVERDNPFAVLRQLKRD
jgi:uncharacterized protein